jgi:hypothetical protein
MRKTLVILLIGVSLGQQLLFAQENNWCWARQSYYGGGEGYGIASDDSGYVYLTGSFNTDVIRFGSIILHNNNNQETSDYFTVKYDKQGNAIWAKSAGGAGYDQDQGFGVTIDNSRNILVIGSFQSREMILGDDTLYNANQNGNGNNDVFIVKYNTYGMNFGLNHLAEFLGMTEWT